MFRFITINRNRNGNGPNGPGTPSGPGDEDPRPEDDPEWEEGQRELERDRQVRSGQMALFLSMVIAVIGAAGFLESDSPIELLWLVAVFIGSFGAKYNFDYLKEIERP